MAAAGTAIQWISAGGADVANGLALDAVRLFRGSSAQPAIDGIADDMVGEAGGDLDVHTCHAALAQGGLHVALDPVGRDRLGGMIEGFGIGVGGHRCLWPAIGAFGFRAFPDHVVAHETQHARDGDARFQIFEGVAVFHGGDHRFAMASAQFLEQRLLGAEMIEDRAFRNVGFAGNIGSAGGGKALAGKQHVGRSQHPCLGFGRVIPAGPHVGYA